MDGVKSGAKHAGRDPEEVAIALIMHCCVCPDAAVALRSVKRTLAMYGSGPFYNRLFVRQGFGKEAQPIMAAAAKGDMNGCCGRGFRSETAEGGGGDGQCTRLQEESRRVRALSRLLRPALSSANRFIITIAARALFCRRSPRVLPRAIPCRCLRCCDWSISHTKGRSRRAVIDIAGRAVPIGRHYPEKHSGRLTVC